MATKEEIEDIRESFDLALLKEKVQKLEAQIEKLQVADASHERDIGRWRTGVLLMAALGGIVTWILNVFSSVKGLVK